ncbi:MAG: SRPBCC family protein [Pyrinomonadaceae bacterium]|nr:SRPBCC family protein [Pyrinomonadaceae bacterium]
MKEDTFVYVTFIKTTAEKLWEALTNSEFIEKYWFGSTFETDWKVGSKIIETRDTGEPGFHGEILESEPPRRLVYSFVVPGREASKVTYEIASHGQMVTLKVIHAGYDKDSAEYKSTSNGWSAIMSGIKTLLETGKPLDKDSIYDLFGRLN